MAQNWAWLVMALLICGAIVHRAHQQTPGCLEASRLLQVENTLYSKLERALVPMRQENTALRAELAALRAAAPIAAARAVPPGRGARDRQHAGDAIDGAFRSTPRLIVVNVHPRGLMREMRERSKPLDTGPLPRAPSRHYSPWR